MKKHLLLVLMIVLMSGMFRANYSFIEFDIGTVRVTIDQWGGLFWDPRTGCLMI